MQTGLYVALSAQLALQRRMETVAHNVANVATAGFRAEEVRFEAALSRGGSEPVAFVGTGESYISRAAGSLSRTGNALDVAVKGEGWLAIATPAGEAYTRDGRMQMAPTGELQTLTGHAVLDAGGSPILLEPAAGTPEIAADGAITQGGRRTGVIGLFALDPAAKLTRHDTSSVRPDRPATPLLDFARNGVLQGFVEGANVNPVAEISRLVMVSRAFEAVTSAASMTESTSLEGIRTLGGAR